MEKFETNMERMNRRISGSEYAMRKEATMSQPPPSKFFEKDLLLNEKKVGTNEKTPKTND